MPDRNLNLYHKMTVLIVDDATENLMLMRDLLKDHYQIKVAKDGETALKIAQSEAKPDIILLDIMMPYMDGYEVCLKLKEDEKTSSIPVIFLTAKSDPESESYGLEIGAVDYITKPISPPIVLARIKSQLQIKAANDFLVDKAVFLEQEVVRRSLEVSAIQELTMVAMATLAGSQLYETGKHLRRTQYFVKALAERLRFNPRFVGFLSDYNINMLFWVAPLHDIGMVAVPSQILLKPRDNPLTSEEFELIKAHTTLGYEAIEQAEKTLKIKGDYLDIAKDVILCHHERMDGSGYPCGLVGDEIPISARLMAIADVYDAHVNERIYKGSSSHEKAVESLIEGKGSLFDPDMLDAFLDIQDDFRAINQNFRDVFDT